MSLQLRMLFLFLSSGSFDFVKPSIELTNPIGFPQYNTYYDGENTASRTFKYFQYGDSEQTSQVNIAFGTVDFENYDTIQRSKSKIAEVEQVVLSRRVYVDNRILRTSFQVTQVSF